MSTELISVTCPHCMAVTVVENKFIPFSLFHHTVYKKNNRQVPPNISQKIYDDLIKSKQVSGCYQPYFLYKQDDGLPVAIKCTYM